MVKPSYKLMYFPMKGRAEVIRLMFAEAGVEYEDWRIPHEEWASHKADTPFGQMPVLFVDRKPLAQSGAICRYLAREFKLDGTTSLESAKADMLYHNLQDIGSKHPFYKKDEAKTQEELMTEWLNNELSPTLEKLDKHCKEFPNEFLVSKNLTYVDLLVQNTMSGMNDQSPEFVKKFPNLQSLMKKIEERPKLKAWIAKRPKTDY